MLALNLFTELQEHDEAAKDPIVIGAARRPTLVMQARRRGFIERVLHSGVGATPHWTRIIG
ncbi:hypothetical protein BH11GEM2_BH11GEM2_41450 [soil metagenome]